MFSFVTLTKKKKYQELCNWID